MINTVLFLVSLFMALLYTPKLLAHLLQKRELLSGGFIAMWAFFVTLTIHFWRNG